MQGETGFWSRELNLLLICRDLVENKEGIIYVLDKEKYKISTVQCYVLYMEDMNSISTTYYKFTGFLEV
jgi:hypothetical protein